MKMNYDDYIVYHITKNQADAICRHFGKELDDIEINDYNVEEMLDKIINYLD